VSTDNTVRVTVLIEGNRNGYYVDLAEMGENVRAWIDDALTDRDDLTAWSTKVETP
jgi:hypothetical protein